MKSALMMPCVICFDHDTGILNIYMLRHIANLGLLLSFVTLAVTGVMSFVLPFSITTTRVHLVFGLATIVLVGMHLATRVRYFTRIASQSVKGAGQAKPQVPRWLLGAIVVVWAGLLATSFYGTQPATAVESISYESRRKAEIVRPRPRTAALTLEHAVRVVQLKPDDRSVLIEIDVEYNDALDQAPVAAIWAETTRGAMIETLYLDPALAYSETPDWHGKPTPRHAILPIWRHRYTLINGIDPIGEIDAVTSATPKHSETLNDYLETDADKLTIYLEFNAVGDTDAAWPDPHVGQPSVVYAVFIDLEAPQTYHLMQLVGHGGGAEQNGEVNYDLDAISSAKQIVEKVLVKLVRDEVQP